MKDIAKFFHNIKLYSGYAVRSAKAELKSEITDSYLNWLWWIIEPLCFMLIYTFVFGYIFKSSEKYFSVFVFIGITVWDFFNRMVTGSVKLIINNRDLVTKVYLPKYILLLSKSFTYLFKLCISFGIVIVLMLFLNVPFHWNMLYFFLILPVLYVISFGVGCLLMHFGVYIQDLVNLTSVGLRFVYMLSGVFYNINTRLQNAAVIKFFLLRGNPIAFIMSEFRKTMIYETNPSFQGLALWFAVGLVLCYLGIRIIHKNENTYAKVI